MPLFYSILDIHCLEMSGDKRLLPSQPRALVVLRWSRLINFKGKINQKDIYRIYEKMIARHELYLFCYTDRKYFRFLLGVCKLLKKQYQ